MSKSTKPSDPQHDPTGGARRRFAGMLIAAAGALALSLVLVAGYFGGLFPSEAALGAGLVLLAGSTLLLLVGYFSFLHSVTRGTKPPRDRED